MRRCTGFRPSRASGSARRVDDRVGVLEKAALHLVGNVDVDDRLADWLGRRLLAGAAGLAGHAVRVLPMRWSGGGVGGRVMEGWGTSAGGTRARPVSPEGVSVAGPTRQGIARIRADEVLEAGVTMGRHG